ncbi:MAG TPA: GNAT family N-acetyltransferase [Gemmatimonadales bacterium]
MIELRPATSGDLKGVLDLLRGHALDLSGVRETFGDFLVAEEQGALIGSIGLEIHGTYALLRSAAIVPGRAGGGIGSTLVDRIVEHARRRGVTGLYLFTTEAAGFFERHDFVRIDRTEMPAELQATKQYTHACGATAVAMRREL